MPKAYHGNKDLTSGYYLYTIGARFNHGDKLKTHWDLTLVVDGRDDTTMTYDKLVYLVEKNLLRFEVVQPGYKAERLVLVAVEIQEFKP